MQLGMIGLGRMGGNIVRRLMKRGHSAVVYDKDQKAVAALAAEGALGAGTLEDFVTKLDKPRTAWVMLPAGKITEATFQELLSRADEGDRLEDLLGADEAFFTGTAAEVTPIREVDGTPIGKRTPGLVTEEIQRVFFAATSGRDQRYKDWLHFIDSKTEDVSDELLQTVS